MVLIPFRDGKVVLCQDAPTNCPIPCGMSVTWTPCNQSTLTSTLAGTATYYYSLDVQFFTLCVYETFGMPGKNTDLFWLVANATPDEIQEPGGGYQIPVPEMPDPAVGVCRFVWRIFTGRGNFYLSVTDGLPDLTTAPTTATPTACRRDANTFSRYAWLAYADVNKCSGDVLNTGLISDTGYNFSAWPVNPDTFGCACTLMGSECDEAAPVFSIGSKFLPDCCP